MPLGIAVYIRWVGPFTRSFSCLFAERNLCNNFYPVLKVSALPPQHFLSLSFSPRHKSNISQQPLEEEFLLLNIGHTFEFWRTLLKRITGKKYTDWNLLTLDIDSFCSEKQLILTSITYLTRGNTPRLLLQRLLLLLQLQIIIIIIIIIKKKLIICNRIACVVTEMKRLIKCVNVAIWLSRNTRRDTVGWGKWSTENCARD